MVFYRKFLFIILVLCFENNIHSQDVYFSQSDNMMLYFNPAATGMYNGFFKAVALHRQQWSGIGKGFITTYASFDAPIYDKRKNKNKAGLGGYFYSDMAGFSKFKTTQASISGSGIVQLAKKHFLSGGISLSYIQKSFDLSGIEWVNQYDGKKYNASINANENTNFPVTSFIDVGIGGRYEFHSTDIGYDSWSYQLFSLDAALFHLTQPVLQYTALTDENFKNRISLNANYLNDFESNRLGINIFSQYMQQGKFKFIQGGVLLRMRFKQQSHITGLMNYSVLSTGIIFRHTGFIVPNIRLRFSYFEIGIAYDAFVSVYQYTTKGMNAFEIQLTYSKLRNSLRNIK
ncbi:MAG TPA: PorP/SprF family type IX secretion system membrane protein [Bacteroidia bacterium]|nr:PorP/SprF family type IX secretion system membrane protein [Bacteroidia bacterium]